jgi:hypothetical protein
MVRLLHQYTAKLITIEQHQSTMAPNPQNPTINFPNHLKGSKRRRMRSGGNVAVHTKSEPKGSEDSMDEKPESSAKCKGATAIPIFLKSEYKLDRTVHGDRAMYFKDATRRIFYVT